MKKKSGFKFVLGFLLVVFVSAVFVLMQVALKLEIEKLTKEKISLEEKINATNNVMTMLQVEVQKLEAKERIVGLAQEKLGMIINNDMNTAVSVDTFQINHVSKTVNSKYE